MRKKWNNEPSTFLVSKNGRHQFGGKATHKGAIPRGCKVPMHLILSLNTKDPLCPVDEIEAKELPLYYPLRYGMGGGEVQYQVCKDSSIRITYIDAQEPDDPADHPYPNQDCLPEMRGVLRAMSYEEIRAAAYADLYSDRKCSPRDKKLLAHAGWTDGIRVGGELLTCRGEVGWECKNSKCKIFERPSVLKALAVVADSPIKGIEIFGCSDVVIFFGLCRACGQVVAVNRCS